MRPPWGWARSHLRLICAGLISTATGPAVAAEPFDRLTNLRDELRNQGFAVAIREVLEGFDNFRGGIQSGRVGASTLEANLAIDTQERLGVPGGKFYVDVQNHAGPDPSTALVGDLQVFDKLNFRPYSQIFELWYQQTLFDNKIRLKIGKVDANTELSHIDNGLYFIHDSAQSSPTIFVFPTTPDPMPGINLFYMPSDLFFISFAVYDANQSDNFLNFSGNPASIQFTRHGQFVIGETGLTWKHFPGLGGDGNLKVGAWGHTGIFERFTGGSQHGAEGYYLVFDQKLWKPTLGEDDERGLGSFLEYGYTDRSVAPIYQHYGGGLAWVGPLASRPQDVLGFGLQFARISPGQGLPYAFELALELFYRIKLGSPLKIQPDLQYIEHPGGQYRNAVVGTLRAIVTF